MRASPGSPAGCQGAGPQSRADAGRPAAGTNPWANRGSLMEVGPAEPALPILGDMHRPSPGSPLSLFRLCSGEGIRLAAVSQGFGGRGL